MSIETTMTAIRLIPRRLLNRDSARVSGQDPKDTELSPRQSQCFICPFFNLRIECRRVNVLLAIGS